KLSSSIARPVEVLTLSQQPSTPVFPQSLLDRQTAPMGTLALPVASRPSRSAAERLPASFPLKRPPLPIPVPCAPEPFFSVLLPNPICQTVAEMFFIWIAPVLGSTVW